MLYLQAIIIYKAIKQINITLQDKQNKITTISGDLNHIQKITSLLAKNVVIFEKDKEICLKNNLFLKQEKPVNIEVNSPTDQLSRIIKQFCMEEERFNRVKELLERFEEMQLNSTSNLSTAVAKSAIRGINSALYDFVIL